jgi:hypothetical protein
MIVSLFKPFPEEHLYSWLVRLYKLSGSADFLSFQKTLGFQDRFLHSNKLFSESSELLVQRLNNRDKALYEHTIAPLWQISIGNLLGDKFSPLDAFSHMNEQQLFGFDTSWQSCEKCREEDLNCYGTSYWHSKHQLPSIFECYRHQSILECANDPIKNLFSDQLPHDIEGWTSVVVSPSTELQLWQSFVVNMVTQYKYKPEELINIRKKVTELLGLNEKSFLKRRAICQKTNSQFEAGLGKELIKYIFRDYSRSTGRGKTNILSSMFANIHHAKGERNPIFWVALAYWLKDELGLNNASFIS